MAAAYVSDWSLSKKPEMGDLSDVLWTDNCVGPVCQLLGNTLPIAIWVSALVLCGGMDASVSVLLNHSAAIP